MAETKEKAKAQNRAFQEMKKAALERLQEKPAEQAAEKTGAVWKAQQGQLELISLGQRIQIAYPSWEIEEELEEWHTLLLYHYLDMAD